MWVKSRKCYIDNMMLVMLEKKNEMTITSPLGNLTEEEPE